MSSSFYIYCYIFYMYTAVYDHDVCVCLVHNVQWIFSPYKHLRALILHAWLSTTHTSQLGAFSPLNFSPTRLKINAVACQLLWLFAAENNGDNILELEIMKCLLNLFIMKLIYSQQMSVSWSVVHSRSSLKRTSLALPRVSLKRSICWESYVRLFVAAVFKWKLSCAAHAFK